MDKIRLIIERKPLSFVITTLVYLLLLVFLKWQFRPQLSSLGFLLGGIIGIYFLDASEEFFHLTPSPFHTVFFQAIFAVVALFVVTSSGSYLAMGLVLSLFLTLVLRMVGEWHATGSIASWLWPTTTNIKHSSERWIAIGLSIAFLLESIMFIR